MTHTPGPWTPVADMVIVRGNKIDREICRLSPDRSPEQNDTDARLIAAAPELLSALEQVLIASEDDGTMDDIDWNGIRTAIAKAKGEA